MRKLLGVLCVLVAVVAVTAFAAAPSSFTVRCGQYNYCTFTSKPSANGTWKFSDWPEPVSGVTYTRPLSTHDPVTLATPYTTTIVHTVGAAVDTGYVQCKVPWDVRGMCREVQKP